MTQQSNSRRLQFVDPPTTTEVYLTPPRKPDEDGKHKDPPRRPKRKHNDNSEFKKLTKATTTTDAVKKYGLGAIDHTLDYLRHRLLKCSLCFGEFKAPPFYTHCGLYCTSCMIKKSCVSCCSVKTLNLHTSVWSTETRALATFARVVLNNPLVCKPSTIDLSLYEELRRIQMDLEFSLRSEVKDIQVWRVGLARCAALEIQHAIEIRNTNCSLKPDLPVSDFLSDPHMQQLVRRDSVVQEYIKQSIKHYRFSDTDTSIALPVSTTTMTTMTNTVASPPLVTTPTPPSTLSPLPLILSQKSH